MFDFLTILSITDVSLNFLLIFRVVSSSVMNSNNAFCFQIHMYQSFTEMLNLCLIVFFEKTTNMRVVATDIVCNSGSSTNNA